MTRLDPIEGEGETEGLKELFAEVRLFFELKEVPVIFRMLGHSPEALKGFWSFTQAVFNSSQSSISRTTRDLVILAASSSAKATHLQDFMTKSLEERGIDRAVLNDLIEKGETLRLPEHTRQILVFARRAALDPAMLSDSDFEGLEKSGLGPRDLAEIVSFAGLVSGLIGMTRALGLTGDKSSKD